MFGKQAECTPFIVPAQIVCQPNGQPRCAQLVVVRFVDRAHALLSQAVTLRSEQVVRFIQRQLITVVCVIDREIGKIAERRKRRFACIDGQGVRMQPRHDHHANKQNEPDGS